MANSNIEWTGKVWNPVTGCNKISQGCKNCYAEKMHHRNLHNPKLKDKYTRPFLDGAFPYEPDLLYPLKFKKPTTFFVNSMSDLFHENVPADYISKVFAVMALCHQHTFQVLTKRDDRLRIYLNSPENEMACWNDEDYILQKEHGIGTMGTRWPLPNVLIGVSVENQETAENRIHNLLLTRAAIRMVSMEPMLERIDLDLVDGARTLDWIIVGGESGPKRRPFDSDWAREIRDFCKDNQVAFFMKQIDKIKPIPHTLQIREFPAKLEEPYMKHMRKRAADVNYGVNLPKPQDTI